MKSQYLLPYMNHVRNQIKHNKKPYSVGTFLAYELKGNAKNWISRYCYSLINGLEKEGWTPGKSKLNGLAYIPPHN